MSKFLFNRQIGDKGESFTMGYLYGAYSDALIQNVTEYYPAGFRWKNRRLPDFLLTEEDKKTLIEVKCKQGWRGMMNIDEVQVTDYLHVADAKGYGFYLLFFFMQDGYIYKLTPEDLKKPTDKFTDRQGKVVYLYDTEGKEKLSQRIPSSIFNSDILRG